MTKNFRWFLAGFAVMLLVLAAVIAFFDNSESVVQEKSVDASEVYSFSFVSQSGDQETDSDEVYYSDNFFAQENTEYDHELARASLALSMTTFKEKHVKSFLEELGYEDLVPYRYDQTGDEDKVALTMAHKQLDGVPLIAVAVRGGKYGDEWGSNGRVGYEGESFGYHYGFHEAAMDAIVQLKEYAAEYGLSLGESKVWLTGFSRGAAVANVMGALLAGEGDGTLNTKGDLASGETSLGSISVSGESVTILPENLFDYTFASPSTVSASLVTTSVDQAASGTADESENRGQKTAHRGIYNIINPLDIVTRLPMNVSGISKTSKGKTVRYNWDYIKYGTSLELPSKSESAQLQVVQLLENALAFATRSETRYVEKTQDQVIIPALKKTMGKGANVSKRNVGFVLIDSLPGVATFLKNEIDRLDFMAQVYVAGILSGKKNIRLEKEHWPETYWGWMMKVDGLE